MDKRILNALDTRFRFLDYIRKVKAVDPSVSGLMFKRREVTGIDYKRAVIEDTWYSVANDYKNEMRAISCCSVKACVEAVSRVSSQFTKTLKETYHEIICKAISEVLVCDYTYDAISVSINGVEPYCSKNGTYVNQGMDSRYTIPDDAKMVLGSICDIYGIIFDVLDDLKKDIADADYAPFIEVDPDNYRIYINVASE